MRKHTKKVIENQLKTGNTKKCRACGNDNFDDVLNMGMNPLVNSLLDTQEIKEVEPLYPLKVVRCASCSLVQIEKPIDANKIYKDVDYLYFSSDMPGLADYFREYCEDVQNRFLQMRDNSFIVEIGSNDGIMLRFFADIGYRVLGIDPATNVAIRALANGIPTIPLFFEERLAKLIRSEMGVADVIYGNNCIAHIDDLDSVLKGVNALLAYDGVFIVECNYWGGMVKNVNYALVYHDHFSYFSLKNWEDLAKKYGMKVFDAIVTPAQGGSLRVFMSKDFGIEATERYVDLKNEEMREGYNTLKVAQQYGKNCLSEALKLANVVKTLYAQKKRIAGYGAAAKGFSVLKLAHIGKELKYFVDDSPAKQGKFTPEHRIPIISREVANAKLPDYFFITAPNYADIIIEKEKERGYTGKFILCDSTIVQ